MSRYVWYILFPKNSKNSTNQSSLTKMKFHENRNPRTQISGFFTMYRMTLIFKLIFENMGLEQYLDVGCSRFTNTGLLEEFLGALESP